MPFSYAAYRSELVAHGVSSDDAEVLVDRARNEAALHAITATESPELLPWFDAHHAELGIDDELWALLLEETLDWEAQGPITGESRSVWRHLHENGCPLDHIWGVLYHCFNDPRSDPQDFVMVGRDKAERLARRYVRLRFPRSRGPWPGLGCDVTLASVRRRIRMFVPATTAFAACELASVSEIARLRTACSEALREVVDRRARWPDSMRTLLPDAPLDEVYALSEEIGRPGIAALLEKWVAAFDAVKRARDIATDRFVLPSEARRTPPLRHRTPSRPPSRARTREVLAKLRDIGVSSSLRVKLYEDPLTWLAMIGVRIHERRWMAELGHDS